MVDTPNLVMPLMDSSQNGKYLTFNNALRRVDSVLRGNVIDSTLATPPSTPTTGDTYIVAATATGAWATKEKNIAVWNGTSWYFTIPLEGWSVLDLTNDKHLYYSGSAWVDNAVKVSTNGASLKVVQKEELVTLSSGETVTSTIQFPAFSIPLFASAYVKTAITGPTNFQHYLEETGGVTVAFSTSSAVTLGTSVVGPASPIQAVGEAVGVTFEDAAVTAGAGGGTAFSGGEVRLTIAYMEAGVAAS
jgi:hypothetical protein